MMLIVERKAPLLRTLGVGIFIFLASARLPAQQESFEGPVSSRCFPEGYAVRGVGSSEAFGALFGFPLGYGRPEVEGRNLPNQQVPVFRFSPRMVFLTGWDPRA